MRNLLKKLLYFGLFFIPTCLYAQVNNQYDIVWNTQSQNSSESMPIGGHDIGCNLWVENGDILLYIQKSGSIAENNEYVKLGRIRLRLDPNPFTKPDHFEQHLKLHDGYAVITAENLNDISATIKVWVDVYDGTVHMDVKNKTAIYVDAMYENWRLEDEYLTNDTRRNAIFSLSAYPGDIVLHKDSIRYEDNQIFFSHRDPENMMRRVGIEQQSLEKYQDRIGDDLTHRTFGGVLWGEGMVFTGQTKGVYQNRPYEAWHLRSDLPQKECHVVLNTHINQTASLEKWEQELKNKKQTSLNTKVALQHKKSIQWWHQFWDRSYIDILPNQQDSSLTAWKIGRNYQLFRYQLGCNAFGEYPTKFNGGNFTFDSQLVNKDTPYGPDYRNWGGGVFTAQNQRLVYWPMLKSGDYDAILAQFELYRKALPGAQARVQEHFKHEGAVYSEYIGVPGIAVPSGYGWSSGRRARGVEIPFNDSRATGNGVYDDIVEKGAMANQSIAYHWESQLEHAYMILQYHKYTGKDISEYMPFIENAVIFFHEHYAKRQRLRTGSPYDDHGKLVIFPSTSCEMYHGAKDPTDVIAGLHACIKEILALEPSLIQIKNAEYYRNFQKHIPDFPFKKSKGKTILDPAKSWMSVRNVECPQFYPLFPFDNFNLQNQDTIQIFRDTWTLGTFPKGMVMSWHQDGIFFARMGMTQEAKEYNTKKLSNSTRRYPTFWGPGHDWVPDHNWGGSGMIGLQEMLMQCFDTKILLLPAWPKEWNTSFKLHAPYNTTVEGEVKNGEITHLKVTPKEREKDIVIHHSR